MDGNHGDLLGAFRRTANTGTGEGREPGHMKVLFDGDGGGEEVMN